MAKKVIAKAKTRALQLNIEALIKLLGGTPEQRLQYWEILKGITTPAELALINDQIATLQGMVNQVQAGAKALKDAASKIARP
jgi:hypothetical protein